MFDNIYKYNLWIFGSGSGSLKINNYYYLDFLKKFLKQNNIKSVCDLGCGDWQTLKHINWDGIRYLGIDCVEDVISKNIKYYQKSNIKFINKNILEFNIPQAEVYILKDILQHLSLKSINTIFDKLKKKKFKYIIIVGDICNINCNIDITDGLYRPLDLNKAPFSKNLKVFNTYYEKTYIYSYIFSLIIFCYLIYKYNYKLYKSVFIVLILYGIFLFPKKNIYLIN
uniref:Methyltransferase domain-containing protein n=1 Tax=viral metagenome TaxID=1070528 RepID=A0A6C0IWH0_9ZZZZ